MGMFTICYFNFVLGYLVKKWSKMSFGKIGPDLEDEVVQMNKFARVL